jgi:pyrroline-5-carboxylate reductase
MGTALVAGAVKSGIISTDALVGLDPVSGARDAFTKDTAAATTEQMSDLADCDAILLCTKPLDACAALADFASIRGGSSSLVISVAAGVKLSALEAAAPSMRVIRTMPNTPALVGEGAAAFSLGGTATEDDARFVRSLLGAVGIAVQVPERLIDAVTGLSGSGPAYAFLMIEALADGGVKCGLPRAEALQLAAQTMLGAAKMVLETGQHPGQLKDMVTSPGGTTIAGLAELERAGLRAALIDAVSAATRRSFELGA